ncbi:MAG TPA: type I restriction endonuclease subunit R, partial [Thermomicrobiales bacterium]|nr:type I restriction endonuclease subunit R [Thermomicrobiales bacterium]
TESTAEEAALTWLAELGYEIASGPELAPHERDDYKQVVLVGRLRAAIGRINPGVPGEAREQALAEVLRAESQDLVGNNRRLHRLLVDGVPVEYRRADGSVVGDRVMLVAWDEPGANDWLAVNQFTVVEKTNRRPDVVVFVNGLPLAVIELKDPTDPNATVRKAFNQLQTYKRDIPSLFEPNALLVASDGLEARVGSLTADWERFMPWRTVSGDDLAPRGSNELKVLLAGIFEHRRFLSLVRSGIVFEDDGGRTVKKLAAYHQFHAVEKAVAATLDAASERGDRRVGVVWHTQGSGKSLSMVFYAGRIIRHPAMENPTIVVLTDRNDLDDQLFGTFARCADILGQDPRRAEARADLRGLLQVASGGVVFTTIQKFQPEEKGDSYPTLSERRNLVVIADEAHRSQYDFIDGYARHLRDALPNASFIAFTGTPIETADKSTQAVFGDYIDVYDIQQAVEDGATVRIFYESRLAKLALAESERPTIDAEFEEVTEGEETAGRERLKTRWARMEAMVGAEKRVHLIAQDIVEHFEQRRQAIEGKAMIVAMSRRIAVDLYNALVALRPEWHSDDDTSGVLKVVMTGSASDPQPFQPHIRSKARREALAERFKDPDDELRVVIVRDMWLTGFDAPSLHTMYVDKPMQGHGLMQAIARVNRVFRDKPGGLIVDYLGIADQLRKALAAYTESDRRFTAIDQNEAVAILLEKLDIVRAMFHGFDYAPFLTGNAAAQMELLPKAMEHILTLDDGKKRYLQAVTELSQAFALSVPHEEALAARDEVGFFQAVRSSIAKTTVSETREQEEVEHAIRQIVSRAVAADEVVDIFAAAGLQRPDISILSDAFLAEVQGLPQKNLALEALRKLLNDEITVRARRNVVEARSFREMLERAIQRYHNRGVETAEIVQELIELAKEMRAAAQRGEQLGLNDEELAFYDALAESDSASAVLGDAQLRTIARELVETVRRNVTVDWTLRDSAQANLRRMVKRVLRRHGYPPDQQESATITVLKQAELFGNEWAA